MHWDVLCQRAHCLLAANLRVAVSYSIWLAGWLLTVLAVSSHPALAQDALRGMAVYEAKCSGCHSVDSNRVGPKHGGVVGRRIGGVPDFAYSAALQKSGQNGKVWTKALLMSWLTDPEALIAGQSMGFRLGSEQERADVVAYLATLK
jgi:cytochrome c